LVFGANISAESEGSDGNIYQELAIAYLGFCYKIMELEDTQFT
jgi:hypothetical protein